MNAEFFGHEGLRLDDPVVIEPRPVKLYPRIEAPTIVLPAEALFRFAASALGATEASAPLDPARPRAVVQNGRTAHLAGPCMGASAAAFVLERLIAQGGRDFIMLGLCGSLEPSLQIGDLVVADAALIEEGVSAHYYQGATAVRAGARATAAIETAGASRGRPCRRGPVWTTDAVFRETRRKVDDYGGRGLLAVEMEASALFNVARYRGVELGALLIVSDELVSPRWKRGFADPRLLEAMRDAVPIALDAAWGLATMTGAGPIGLEVK